MIYYLAFVDLLWAFTRCYLIYFVHLLYYLLSNQSIIDYLSFFQLLEYPIPPNGPQTSSLDISLCLLSFMFIHQTNKYHSPCTSVSD